jgi:peptidoglycan/LPS O-acetylase OafA/YrhL
LLPVLIFVTVETGGQWLTLQNWQPLARLFALGAVSWQNIGPVGLGEYNAGLVWTLKYEWYFYLTLPFVAWLIIGRKIFGVSLTVYALILAGLWLDLNLLPGLFLIMGALCSELLASQPLRSKLQGSIATVTALLTSALLAVLRRHDLGATIPTDSLGIVCLPIFVVAAAGNNFFGILTHPAMRCLGAISFSLYLLHGIAFWLAARGLKAAGMTNLLSLECWGVFVATACITTGICALTYRWIEFPFLSKSHKRLLGKSYQTNDGYFTVLAVASTQSP